MRPNFFIVGAAKAGTTMIGSILRQHPDIYISPIKEPHFFCEDIQKSEFRKDYRERTFLNLEAYFDSDRLPYKHIAHIDNYDHYLKLFSGVTTEKAIGELSTGYLYSTLAADNIYTFNKDAKIVIILRQPVERAYSHYLMNKRAFVDYDSSFINALERDYATTCKGWGKSHLYVELGLYFEQVNRYLKKFPNDKVKVLLYNDLLKEPAAFVNELWGFLGVEAITGIDISERKNVAEIPKFKIHPSYLPTLNFIKNRIVVHLPNKIRESMRNLIFDKNNVPTLSNIEFENAMEYFRDDIQRLSVLIDRDLNIWNQKTC